MENEITYIPMDPEFRYALRERYFKPLKGNIILLTIVSIVFYLIIELGARSAAENGRIKFSGRGSTTYVSETSFYFWLAIAIGIVYVFCVLNFCLMRVQYKQDADFGQIVREKAYVSSVYQTPVGHYIYWLNSESIPTFTPDPYRNFNVGDRVTIYYLKFSKEYLSYEIS